MTRTVTFDTNVLDLVCRPERSPKNPLQPAMQKVHQAIKDGTIKGHYSVTLLTIEGIMRQDRAAVFAGTKTVKQPEKTKLVKNADLPEEIRAKVGDADLETIEMELRVEQPARKPLPPEFSRRVKAAKELGFKVLDQVPRIGAFAINDPTGEFYLKIGEAEGDLKRWIDTGHNVLRQIEARGLGLAQLKALGLGGAVGDPGAIWWESLDKTTDAQQQRAIEKAFAEWADADSIAAHIAYGIDVFCSEDVGNSHATNSIFDPANRAWLTSTFGVNFMTLEQLAASLP